VHCLGGERSKIATPNMDRLAAAGMIFTEAHSSSAVCSPTRYATRLLSLFGGGMNNTPASSISSTEWTS
jgi:arylsulfatase A-like enzyme